MKISEASVLSQLKAIERQGAGPQTLIEICVRLGIRKNIDGIYSRVNYYHYANIGRYLQTLKRRGKVVYLSKAQGGPGWRLFKP